MLHNSRTSSPLPSSRPSPPHPRSAKCRRVPTSPSQPAIHAPETPSHSRARNASFSAPLAEPPLPHLRQSHTTHHNQPVLSYLGAQLGSSVEPSSNPRRPLKPPTRNAPRPHPQTKAKQPLRPLPRAPGRASIRLGSMRPKTTRFGTKIDDFDHGTHPNSLPARQPAPRAPNRQLPRGQAVPP